MTANFETGQVLLGWGGVSVNRTAHAYDKDEINRALEGVESLSQAWI